MRDRQIQDKIVRNRYYSIENRFLFIEFKERVVVCTSALMFVSSTLRPSRNCNEMQTVRKDNKAECFHSLHDPVLKSLSSAIKEAIFGKSLLVYLENIRQVAKIDHAQGQIQCSNTCTLFLYQNLFPSSYFLSWQRFLSQFF